MSGAPLQADLPEPTPFQAWVERVRQRFRPPRRAVPTRAGLFVLNVPIVLGIAAVSASNNLLFMLLATALGAIVLSGILSERNIKGVRVRVRAIAAAYVSEPCPLEVRLQRPPGMPTAFGLQVRELVYGIWTPWRAKRYQSPDIVDAFVPVLEGREAVASSARRFERRGRARIPTCELVTRYPFALLHKARDVEVDLDVLVRPKRVPVPETLLDPRRGAGEGDLDDRKGHGVEIYGLRERQAWDAAQRVHALRSMSLGRDVVLETTQSERPTAWLGVAFTPGADPEAAERALEVAQAVLTHWEERGFAVGVALPHQRLWPDEASLDGVLDCLARAEPAAYADDQRRGPGLWLVPAGASAPKDVTAIHVDAAGRLEERAA